jgi:hypothetical protein
MESVESYAVEPGMGEGGGGSGAMIGMELELLDEEERDGEEGL